VGTGGDDGLADAPASIYVTAFLVAAVSVVAVWCYRYEFVWTPLER
jgi:hypothetical protein